MSLILVCRILPAHLSCADFCLTDPLSPVPPAQTQYAHMNMSHIEDNRAASVSFPVSASVTAFLLSVFFPLFFVRIDTQERFPCICRTVGQTDH